ncbi:unnamed protein product [Sphagnum troendelagicum]
MATPFPFLDPASFLLLSAWKEAAIAPHLRSTVCAIMARLQLRPSVQLSAIPQQHHNKETTFQTLSKQSLPKHAHQRQRRIRTAYWRRQEFPATRKARIQERDGQRNFYCALAYFFFLFFFTTVSSFSLQSRHNLKRKTAIIAAESDDISDGSAARASICSWEEDVETT